MHSTQGNNSISISNSNSRSDNRTPYPPPQTNNNPTTPLTAPTTPILSTNPPNTTPTLPRLPRSSTSCHDRGKAAAAERWDSASPVQSNAMRHVMRRERLASVGWWKRREGRPRCCRMVWRGRGGAGVFSVSCESEGGRERSRGGGSSFFRCLPGFFFGRVFAVFASSFGVWLSPSSSGNSSWHLAQHLARFSHNSQYRLIAQHIPEMSLPATPIPLARSRIQLPSSGSAHDESDWMTRSVMMWVLVSTVKRSLTIRRCWGDVMEMSCFWSRSFVPSAAGSRVLVDVNSRGVKTWR